ncbi:MAG: extracellular solute-binding protein, partial [Erysipelotrichaceae bacterium]
MRLRILSFLALSLLLSGCDSINHNNVTPVVGTKDSPLWSQPNQEEVTLSWYINYAWFTTKWGHNKISQKITEDTGISIDFIVPSGSENTALDALILADDLPDLITLGWWEPQIDYMIDNNMVHAINTLADTHDPYFWKVGDPDTLGWYTKDDGNVYAYPNSSFTPSDYDNYENIPSNQTFLVRKDIYEAIGSPDMSTQEGFKSAIKKALEMFPEVNGEPLIPFGAHEFTEKGNDSFDTFLMNFLAIPYEKEGTFYDRFSDPEYVSWLKLFREMYEEGLLSNDVFFDKRTQVSEKVAEGRYFAMLYQYTDLKDQQKLLYSQDPDSIYYAIDGPKNENKDDHVLTGNSVNGWTVTLISKKSKYPERAMALMTYMISEYGQKITSIGIKDDMYDVIEGKP